jgi:excisionase family DNA binding protein
MTEPMLTSAQVARILGISRRCLYNLIQKNQLPAIRVGGVWRFKRADLLKFMETTTNA